MVSHCSTHNELSSYFFRQYNCDDNGLSVSLFKNHLFLSRYPDVQVSQPLSFQTPNRPLLSSGSTMAQHFLDQLPRIAKQDLSDSTCIICQEEYGTNQSDSEPAEEAVRLPCPGGHIVGLRCISSWFSPGVNRTSCPYCRHEFTALSPRLLVEARQPPDNHTQGFDRWRTQWREFRSLLVAAGGTPELVRKWDEWFAMWNHATVPHGNGSEPRIQATETLFFREYYHYILRLPGNGLSMYILDGPQHRLTHVDEACIFSRLRRIGAFRNVLVEVASHETKWRILRSQGYVFDEERWVWYARLYS